MLRFLALTLLAYLIWQGIERLLERVSPSATAPGPRPRPDATPAAPVPLTQCVVCGVHFPAAGAVRGAAVCSESCRRAKADRE